MVQTLWLLSLLSAMLMARNAPASSLELQFERIGRPFPGTATPISAVSITPDQRCVAWGQYNAQWADPSLIDAVGVFGDTGEVLYLGLQEKFGQSYVRMVRAQNGNMYFFSGSPAGHFLKFDMQTMQLVDLGAPAANATYPPWRTVAPDGRIYVGTYPEARVLWCDPSTDTVGDLGVMTTNAANRYAFTIAVDAANRHLYVPVGLHTGEIWSHDLQTGEKRQIMPASIGQAHTFFYIYRCTDGNVYGHSASDNSLKFRCYPDRTELVGFTPPIAGEPSQTTGCGYQFNSITEDNQLRKRNLSNGQWEYLDINVEGSPSGIYSIGCERDGIVFGGGTSPLCHLFTFDPNSGELKDMGGGTEPGGAVQIYDVLSHQQGPHDGLFISSYGGAHFDFYDPRTGAMTNIASLADSHQQERAPEMALGPDGMIYSGTIPTKGHLGGAVVRINPQTFGVDVWRNVIQDQSFNDLTPIPGSREICFSSSIHGGTTAVPTTTEASVMLWDVDQERIVWQGRPLPGTRQY